MLKVQEFKVLCRYAGCKFEDEGVYPERGRLLRVWLGNSLLLAGYCLWLWFMVNKSW